MLRPFKVTGVGLSTPALEHFARLVSEVFQSIHNCVEIIDATAPCTPAGILQSGPKPCIRRQPGVWHEILTRRTSREHPHAFLRPEDAAVLAHEIYRSFQACAIDHDVDQIAISYLTHRTARQSFRRYVADTGARRYATEPGIRNYGDILAKAQ